MPAVLSSRRSTAIDLDSIVPVRKGAIMRNFCALRLLAGRCSHTAERIEHVEGLSFGAALAAAVAASIGLASALATPAAAQGGVNVGNLSCNVVSGWGFMFGSSRGLNCTFAGTGRRYEYYAGNIAKFGVDIGYTQGGVLIWTVIAPTANLGPGALAGSYAGATASATVGVGVGRQCADRRLRQHDRAAAAQHRGQYRPQRRRRDRGDDTHPGPVTLITPDRYALNGALTVPRPREARGGSRAAAVA